MDKNIPKLTVECKLCNYLYFDETATKITNKVINYQLKCHICNKAVKMPKKNCINNRVVFPVNKEIKIFDNYKSVREYITKYISERNRSPLPLIKVRSGVNEKAGGYINEVDYKKIEYDDKTILVNEEAVLEYGDTGKGDFYFKLIGHFTYGRWFSLKDPQEHGFFVIDKEYKVGKAEFKNWNEPIT